MKIQAKPRPCICGRVKPGRASADSCLGPSPPFLGTMHLGQEDTCSMACNTSKAFNNSPFLPNTQPCKHFIFSLTLAPIYQDATMHQRSLAGLLALACAIQSSTHPSRPRILEPDCTPLFSYSWHLETPRHVP